VSVVGNKITALLHDGAQTGASGCVANVCLLRWRLKFLFIQHGSDFTSLSDALSFDVPGRFLENL
jgi:hypothetical protein